MSPTPLAEHDTDSDSDLSLEDDQSGSYGSTHSSESEDEAPPASWDTLPGPALPSPGTASLGGHPVGVGVPCPVQGANGGHPMEMGGFLADFGMLMGDTRWA